MPRPSSFLSSRGTGERWPCCGGRRSSLVGATARGLPDRAVARLRVRGGGEEWCVARNREGGAINSRSEGDVSPLELSGRAANSDEKLQCKGARTQPQRRSFRRSRTSTRGGGISGQVHARTVDFGCDMPVLAEASPASASARERSRAMGRGWWHGAAVIGERWIEHMLNRGDGDT